MVQIAPPDQVFVVFARIGLPVGHYVRPVGNAGHVAVHVVGEQNPFRGLFLPDECLERCNVQGWADDRIDTVLAIQSDNQAYKQAGNGVTVHVVEAIGRRIAKMDAELRGEALAP